MDSRSYIKLTGNLVNIGITGTTASTTISTVNVPTRIKSINIGTWDMSAGVGSHVARCVAIPSEIALNKIRYVSALIYTDSGINGDSFPFNVNNSDWETSGRIRVDCTNRVVELIRNSTGLFCQSAFNSSSVNRGIVNIEYSVISASTLTTGRACNVTCTSMNICGNIINTTGNASICEYGVIYSQTNPSPNYSDCKCCTIGTISINTPFCKPIYGLADCTPTYFRAYARNCEDIGFGTICCCATLGMPLPTCVCLDVCADYNYGNQSKGTITITPSLGVGQWLCAAINYQQSAPNAYDVDQIKIYCKPFGYLSWLDISSCMDPTCCMCTDNLRNFGADNVCFCVNRGDCICYENNSFGNSGSFSEFHLYPVYGCCSSGLTVTYGTCNFDCVSN